MEKTTTSNKFVEKIRDHYNQKNSENEFELMDYMIDGKPISEDLYDQVLLQPLIEKLDLFDEARVLDIGCGVGKALSKIEHHCKKAVGVDISNNLLSRYKGSSEVFVCAAHELEFPKGSFDRIYMLSVGIHFPSFDYFKEVVNKCLDILDKGGILVISDLIITSKTYNSQYLIINPIDLVEYLEEKNLPYSISAQNKIKRSFSRRKDILIYKD